MAILDFLGDFKRSELRDFWDLHYHDVPESPGVYILVARGDSHFHYPMGRSPVFYIGQSKNLKVRLDTHLRWAKQARDDRLYHLYYTRYEFAAAYAGRYCFIRTRQGLTPKALEEEVMARFAKKYRSFPIANGQGSWNRINKVHRMD